MNPILSGIWNNKLIRNKFLIVFVFFILWVLIFDQNSVINQISIKKKLKKLKADKEFYQDKISKDSIRLEELKNNPDNIEDFARENYYMKKKGEDIYVIVEKEDEE